MKNDYQNELEAIIKRAQRDALNEVYERLQLRWEQIDRILINGRSIWEQTNGDRFNRMFALRSTLITKMMTLSDAYGVIYDVMYKKWTRERAQALPHPKIKQVLMEQKERLRKEYAKNGSAQKMMTFRADVDVVAILANVANKGRLINNLVKEWSAAHRPMAVEHDDAPEVYDIPLSDEL